MDLFFQMQKILTKSLVFSIKVLLNMIFSYFPTHNAFVIWAFSPVGIPQGTSFSQS